MYVLQLICNLDIYNDSLYSILFYTFMILFFTRVLFDDINASLFSSNFYDEKEENWNLYECKGKSKN